MQEKENILRIFEESKKALKKEDVLALKELSNETIHTASISQDPDNIAIAVIIYSLSKIVERKKYQGYPEWKKFYKKIIECVDLLLETIKKENYLEMRNQINMLRKNVESLSGNLKKYILEVFRKASINKASRIYEHGISMEKTAKLLGISIWELAEYSGTTGISNVSLGKTIDIQSRIKIVNDIFE